MLQNIMNHIPTVIDAFVTNLLIPLIIVIASGVLLKVQSIVSKWAESAAIRNEQEGFNATTTATSNILSQLEKLTGAAVAANMSLSDKLKEASADGKLTEDEIAELKISAREMVFSMMPTDISFGTIMQLFGGEEAFNDLIFNLIEKQLITIKGSLTNAIPFGELFTAELSSNENSDPTLSDLVDKLNGMAVKYAMDHENIDPELVDMANEAVADVINDSLKEFSEEEIIEDDLCLD